MDRGGRIDPTQFPSGALDDDARIDVAIAESFPASDPPSWNSGVETRLEWRIAEIVAATDLSDCSRNALDHAMALARATDAGLTVVHARVDAPDYRDLYRPVVRERGSRAPRYSDLFGDVLDPSLVPAYDEEAAAALSRTHHHQLEGLPLVRQVAFNGEPVASILGVAHRAGAAIIVVGSHARRALAGALLGSTADAVIRRSGVAVLAVPCDAPRKEEGAVVAILDEPDVASDIVRHASAVAKALRAELVKLHVPNDGRVHERPELTNARLTVIAFPRDEARWASRSDPNVRVLLRSGLISVLTIPSS